MRIKTRRHKDRLNNDPERGLLFTNSQNNTLKCFIEHKRIKFYNTPGLSRGKAAGKIRNMAEENIEEVFLTPFFFFKHVSFYMFNSLQSLLLNKHFISGV